MFIGCSNADKNQSNSALESKEEIYNAVTTKNAEDKKIEDSNEENDMSDPDKVVQNKDMELEKYYIIKLTNQKVIH